MRCVGVDPGSNNLGWAVLQRERAAFVLIDWGVVKTDAKQPVARRLLALHEGLSAALRVHQVELAAIEQIFAHKSSESALRLGQARGVALLCLAQAGLEVGEYNPMTIKKSVTGSGSATKEQMQHLTQRLLGLAAPLPPDAADAVGVAMTHLLHHGLQARLEAHGLLQPGGGR